MSNERNAPAGGGDSLADRLASIIAESAIKPGSVAPTKAPAPSQSGAEWHFIQAGRELGPFPLAEMVEKAIAGEIEADDLVKQTGGPWAKAREVAFLQREFDLREARERTVNQLGQFHGVWISKKALVIGGGALLAVVGMVAFWAIRDPAGAPKAVVAEKNLAPHAAIVQQNEPPPVAIEKAKPDFEKKDARFFTDRARAWFDKKQYDETIGDCDQAIGLDPNNARLYNFRGWAWHCKENYDAAIKDYDDAIRLDSDSDLSYYNRGYAYFCKGDYDRAITDYGQAIRLKPTAGSYAERGNAWHSKKDYDKAIRDYNEAIGLDPKNALSYSRRGNAWDSKKVYDEAIRDYSEAIRLNPNYAIAYFSRGSAWNARKEYDKAIKDYSEAIRLDPKNALSYSLRGSAWNEQREHDKAIKDFDEAIRLNPDNGFAFALRGLAWECKRDDDKAIVDYDEALRLNPNNELAAAGRKDVLLRKRFKENPVQTFKDCLKHGMTPEQINRYATPADKSDIYGPGELIADFNVRVPKGQIAAVTRYSPFEVPGVAAPRYRVNLLFTRSRDRPDLPPVLQEWHFRSPN